MKTFVLLVTATGFVGLAYNSMHYKPVHIKPEPTRTEAKADCAKPIILKGTYRPKNEKERQAKIAEIWGIDNSQQALSDLVLFKHDGSKEIAYKIAIKLMEQPSVKGLKIRNYKGRVVHVYKDDINNAPPLGKNDKIASVEPIFEARK